MHWGRIGTEFLVNTTTVGRQYGSAVTLLADGRFVVTWTDESATGSDISNSAVRGQIFAADGSKSGGEFLVNTTTVSAQRECAVTTLTDGHFVVTWTDASATGGDISFAAVRGQIFAADGSKSSGEFLANTTTTYDQSQGAVAALAGGRFIVTWTDTSASSGGYGDLDVRGQIFAADGSKSGGELLVNTSTTNDQSQNAVAVLADGRFVVTWTDTSTSGGDISGWAVRGQLFSTDGSKLGGEFLVNTTTGEGQFDSAVAVLADGRFVVTWTDTSASGGDTSGWSVRGQMFGADGSKSGGEFLVNTTTDGWQYDSAVAALPDGRFVVTWRDDSATGDDTSFSAVRAQLFAADGSKSGGEFLVNTTTTNHQSQSAVTALSDGHFVVTWSDFSLSDGDNSDQAVRGQIFDATIYDGTAAVDSVTGGNFDDRISGYGGDDFLNGGAGADVIYGGDGNDSIQGDQNFTAFSGNDVILSEAGDDVVFAGPGDDVVALGAGFDVAIGEGGNDALNGEGGNDAIDGGDGNDTLLGWDDQDILFGSVGNDLMYGGNGNDIMMGNRGDPIDPIDGVDFMFGDAGQDTIHGGAGDDGILGGTGNDVIDGGLGNDVIIGGEGADIMLGSGPSAFGVGTAGNDIFVYNSVAEGGDSIYGFDTRAGNEDRIFLNTLFDGLGYAGTTPRADGYLYVLQGGLDTVIFVDANGATGGANLTQLVTLIGVTASTVTDSFFLFQ